MHSVRLKKKITFLSASLCYWLSKRLQFFYYIPFVYFRALIHGIISLFPRVLSNDSFVAYVDFFPQQWRRKKIFKGKCNYKNIVFKNNYKNVAKGMWMGQGYYHLIDRLKIVFLLSPSRDPSSFLSLSLNYIFLYMKLSHTLWKWKLPFPSR